MKGIWKSENSDVTALITITRASISSDYFKYMQKTCRSYMPCKDYNGLLLNSYGNTVYCTWPNISIDFYVTSGKICMQSQIFIPILPDHGPCMGWIFDSLLKTNMDGLWHGYGSIVGVKVTPKKHSRCVKTE